MVARNIQESLANSSWIRRMFEEGIRLSAQVGAENVYDFSLGNPDGEPPEVVLDAMARHIRERDAHKYMPNAGIFSVRERIAAHLSRDLPFALSADNIVMTVGAAGGLNAAFKALLDPGDEVIVLAPYFAEYLFYIRNHGGVPVIVPTLEGSFAPDPAAVAAALTPHTKAILLNSPNNPTGVIYTAEQLAALAAVLPDSVCVLSDEPYAKLVYNGAQVPQVLTIFKNVMVINSFSKSLALPGERIGYIAFSPRCDGAEQINAALSFSVRTLGFVNAPSLMQRVVADALNVAVDPEIYRERRDALHGILVKAGFDCPLPAGAFYLFPRSPIADDVAFVRRAVDYHLLVVPGLGFGGPGHFRLAYCTSMDSIERSRPAFLALGREYFG